jgi:hypothetical protein
MLQNKYYSLCVGYEWNKYNQTHYDTDNPPPKVVQGYKFNILYHDLIDKQVVSVERGATHMPMKITSRAEQLSLSPSVSMTASLRSIIGMDSYSVHTCI